AAESGVANTVDPLAGSYFVGALPGEMERGVREYCGRIAALGGVLPASAEGFFQGEIADAGYEQQPHVESRGQSIVGVDEYVMEEEQPVPILKIGPEIQAKQLERLARVKRERDGARVQAALEEVRRVAATDENLLPPILEAVKAYATLGEIVDVLRSVFG